MTLQWLLTVCQTYGHMGTAIQEQLHDIAAGESLDDQNPNALRVISDDFLGRVACDADEGLQAELIALKTEIDEYLAENDEEEF